MANMSVQTGDTVDPANFRGIIFPYAGPSAPIGFLLCDGAAVSRATYSGLFALIGITYGAGDGSTTFNVPDLRGRMMIGAGTGGASASFNASSDVTPASDQITVPTNDWLITGQAIALAGSSLPIGLAVGTYYAIRVDATHIKLATSIANAQNGVAVDITAAGSGTATITQTLTPRAMGSKGGEETHAMSQGELLSHTHEQQRGTGSSSGSQVSTTTSRNPLGGAGEFTRPTGGNEAMNIMSPYAVLNFVIKT